MQPGPCPFVPTLMFPSLETLHMQNMQHLQVPAALIEHFSSLSFSSWSFCCPMKKCWWKRFKWRLINSLLKSGATSGCPKQATKRLFLLLYGLRVFTGAYLETGEQCRDHFQASTAASTHCVPHLHISAQTTMKILESTSSLMTKLTDAANVTNI